MNKNQAIQKLLHKSGLCIRKYSPVALSCVASAGVVVTAIAAAKATPRAVALVYADSRKKHDGDPYAYTKKEAFIAAWKCYIPAVAFGASTIACIMGANALNRRQQAALTSAYALVQSSYKEYKDKLNRNFMFAGVIPLNDFYEFLGLEKTELGDAVGWSSCNGDIYWIDFNHHRLTLDDGMEIYVIDMVFEPTAEWMEDL